MNKGISRRGFIALQAGVASALFSSEAIALAVEDRPPARFRPDVKIRTMGDM